MYLSFFMLSQIGVPVKGRLFGCEKTHLGLAKLGPTRGLVVAAAYQLPKLPMMVLAHHLGF